MSKAGVAFAMAVVFASTAPLFAHHSFSFDYDWKKPVTLSGTVTRIAWANPHTVLTLAATDGSGSSWTIEMAKPTLLAYYGWSQTILKQGDRVSIDGWVARDGSPRMNARSVSLSDGRQLFAASSFFRMPPPISRGTPDTP